MKWKLSFTKRAWKNLNKLEEEKKNIILSNLRDLIRAYESGIYSALDLKALKGKYRGIFRLRVGAYRVLFEVKKKKREIVVIDVVSRKVAYR